MLVSLTLVLLCRCFVDKSNATHPLVFNDRESASPGTAKMPKLCGTSTIRDVFHVATSS